MPVLPLVASMTVCPGFSSPLRSAASITPNASRSLTDPSGLKASNLTKSSTPGGASFATLTTGVRPTVSRMLLNRLVIGCSAIPLGRCDRGERRQGLLDHSIGRGEADPQIAGRAHDGARQHEHLAISQRIPMPLRVAVGHLLHR